MNSTNSYETKEPFQTPVNKSLAPQGVMWFIPLVRSPRVTHEGNKCHDSEPEKANIWIIFTSARIPQPTQENVDEKMYLFFLLFNLFFLNK